MIVSAFISVRVLRKQGKIKKASVLTRLPHLLGPYAALIGRMTETTDGG